MDNGLLLDVGGSVIGALGVSDVSCFGFCPIAIGFFQSIAMWSGISRSMMTIMGGMLLGLNPIASAEFSFLLGLPTLLAATLFKSLKEGHVLMANVSVFSMAIGLVVAGFSALLAVRGFVSWLNKHGLAPFGYYRIAIALVLFYLLVAK
jgi:undecaprenyl-diphosphatase